MDASSGRPAETGGATTKISVPPNAFYVPSPVVLLTTVSEQGEVDVSAMSAVGVVCLDPAIIAVGIKPRRHTYKNIRRTGRFVVNLPLEKDMWAADFTGTRSWRRSGDKVAESGLEIRELPGTGLPYVESCPIVMACDAVGHLGRKELNLEAAPSHQTVLGRIAECLVDAEWLGQDEVRLEDMPVLLYLNRVYARRGPVLGEQRFTDDPRRRRDRMRAYRSLGGAHDTHGTHEAHDAHEAHEAHGTHGAHDTHTIRKEERTP
ncbi:flavin reductase family protein [Streptomyces sp. NPDC059517]|uniref:flavin reductase family protein n=1 Tax=Streptomyces sp. NPDC059517 TaxID=3346855 RepID=UPI0036922610